MRLAALFGSHAEGRVHARSDVDLAVDWAPEASPHQREAIVTRIERALGSPVDAVDVQEAPPLPEWRSRVRGYSSSNASRTLGRTFARAPCSTGGTSRRTLAACTRLPALGWRPPCMVRADVAASKIARAEAWLREVEQLAEVDVDTFCANQRNADPRWWPGTLHEDKALTLSDGRGGVWHAWWSIISDKTCQMGLGHESAEAIAKQRARAEPRVAVDLPVSVVIRRPPAPEAFSVSIDLCEDDSSVWMAVNIRGVERAEVERQAALWRSAVDRLIAICAPYLN